MLVHCSLVIALLQLTENILQFFKRELLLELKCCCMLIIALSQLTRCVSMFAKGYYLLDGMVYLALG